MICPQCERETGRDLAVDETCLDCLMEYLQGFPHEQDEIICVDYDASIAAESTDSQPEIDSEQ